jgi:hypothetical protein
MATVIQFPYHKIKSALPTPEEAVAALLDKAAPGRAAGGPPRAGKDADKADKAELHRKALLCKIHIALAGFYKTLPGFSEDVYRYTLEDKWGVSSAADLSHEQLHQCLLWLKSLGFQSSSPYWRGRDARGLSQLAMIGRINQLLVEKHKIQDKFAPLAYAEGILARQTAKAEGGPVKNIYQATPKQLRAVIAALDKDGKRKRRRA